jgi:hypothetical protein
MSRLTLECFIRLHSLIKDESYLEGYEYAKKLPSCETMNVKELSGVIKSYVRKVDELGRVVIPIELRRSLEIEEKV